MLRGVHSHIKSMMQIAYLPCFHKIYKFPPYFRQIYKISTYFRSI